MTYSSRNRVLRSERHVRGADGVRARRSRRTGLHARRCERSNVDAWYRPVRVLQPVLERLSRSRPSPGASNPDLRSGGRELRATCCHWLFGGQNYTEQSDLLTWDARLSGETPWTLPGGTVGWAAGLQVRNEKYDLSLNRLTDLDKTPCPFVDPYSVTLGNTQSLTCASPDGSVRVPCRCDTIEHEP